MNIFNFEFKRLLKSCIIWSLVCGALITLFMSLFPTMEDMGMQQIVNQRKRVTELGYFIATTKNRQRKKGADDYVKNYYI